MFAYVYSAYRDAATCSGLKFKFFSMPSITPLPPERKEKQNKKHLPINSQYVSPCKSLEAAFMKRTGMNAEMMNASLEVGHIRVYFPKSCFLPNVS